MGLVIRSSDIVRTDRTALAIARRMPADVDVARPPLLWPRWIRTGPNTGRTVFEAIHPSRIPAGWQSIRFTVAQRLATCEEVDCPMYLGGWTEVVVGDGNRVPEAGEITVAAAIGRYGLYGPHELAPQTVHHPPGTICPGDRSLQPTPAERARGATLNPRAHRKAVDIPPLYTVNGRPTLWNEFEDALGGGIHRAQQLRAEGHD